MGKHFKMIGLVVILTIMLTGCIPSETPTPTARPAPELLQDAANESDVLRGKI